MPRPLLCPLWAVLAACLLPQEAHSEVEDPKPSDPVDSEASSPKAKEALAISTLKSLGLPQPDFHSLILDMSTLSFVDTVCLKSLKNVRVKG